MSMSYKGLSFFLDVTIFTEMSYSCIKIVNSYIKISAYSFIDISHFYIEMSHLYI